MASPFDPNAFANDPHPAVIGARTCDVRLFGSFRVRAADGSDATPNGRKARALIAFLLLADGETATRDRLAGLLWSERGDDQARASLRQTLYEMRELTAGDAALLASDRARARIEPGRVVTDLDRMRTAAATNDTAALVMLVGEKPSDLLADLDGIDPAFDDWLVVERARRGDERRRVVLAAADQALTTGDVDGAHRLALRMLAADPTDETVARLAMEASHRRGDRDSMRQIFGRLHDALRQDLGVEPSGETVALHQRLMSAPMPQRAVNWPEIPEAVEAANDDPMQGVIDRSAVHAKGEVAAPHPEEVVRAEPARRSMPRYAMPAVVALIAVIVGAVAWWRPAATPSPRTLMVEPFDVAPTDAAAQPLRSGFAADLAHLMLGNDTRLSVIDAAQATRTARESGFVVAGDAQSTGPMLHVNLKLRRANDPTILWSGSVTRSAAEIDALREQMAAKVADVAVCALGTGNAKLEDFQTETIRLLLGACEEKHGDWNESAKLMRQVVALQPEFAHGWAMLSAATAVSTLLASGDHAAQSASVNTYADRALSLDPREGEAYFAKAVVLRGIGQWIPRMALLQAGHAVEPANAALNATIASSLAKVGRLQEATGFSQLAVDGDAFSAEKAAQRVRLLGLYGDIPDAGIALQAAHRRFASNRAVALTDFRFAALAGDTTRAAAMLADPDRGFTLQPDRIAMWRALVAARATPTPALRDAAYQAFATSMQAHPQIDLDTLEKLAMLQRVDEAYATADRLPAESVDNETTDLLFTTVTAPLRADPRFMTLSARLGLVAIWTQTDRWPDFCAESTLPYDCRVEAKRALSGEARPLVAVR